MLFKDPLKISFTGRHADVHMLDAAKLSQSLAGLSRIINSSIYYWENKSVPKPKKLAPYNVLVAAPKAGSMDIFLNPESLAGLLPIVNDALMHYPKEIISHQLKAILFRNADKSEEYERTLYYLWKSRQQDLLSNQIERQQFYAHQEEMAKINRNPSIKTVANLGRDANNLEIESSDRTGTLDAYDAEIIRKKGEAVSGVPAIYIVRVDGLVKHNRTLRLRIKDAEDKIVAASVVDPNFDNSKNVYLSALNSQEWLSINARPVLINNEINKLVVLNSV